MAEASNPIIYTIGLFDGGNPDWNSHVLKRLAAETGGEVFLPARTVLWSGSVTKSRATSETNTPSAMCR